MSTPEAWHCDASWTSLWGEINRAAGYRDAMTGDDVLALYGPRTSLVVTTPIERRSSESALLGGRLVTVLLAIRWAQVIARS